MANDALDTLQIDILASGTSAAEGIDKLASAIGRLKTAVGNAKGLSTLSTKLEGIQSAVHGIDANEVTTVAKSITQLAQAMRLANSAVSGMSSVKQALNRLSGMGKLATTAQKAVEKLNSTTNSALSGEGRATPTAQKLKEVADATKGIEQARKAAEQEPTQAIHDQDQAYRQVASTARRVFNQIRSTARSTLNTIIKLVRGIGDAFIRVGSIVARVFTAPFTLIGRKISGIAKQITGLFRAIGRIALYRALRSAIKELTQGLNEGIQNLYQWSLIVDRTFANSMDSIASSMLYLKNGFASMFSPLINYAAPIIEQFVDKLVDMFNVVQQVFAALTGASTWTKAIRVQKQYAEAVTDTGKAADKAMHQVMAFDELNIINSPHDSGSSGKPDNTPDYASMFVTQEVDTALASWVKTIKDFFESGQFRELGEYIGQKLNGLVSRWESYTQGFDFGLKIRHALEALNGFLETFNFYDLGSKVGDWIAGFVDGVTPEEITNTLVNLINSAVSGMSGLADKLLERGVPAKIGQAIGTAFANFNWEGMANLAKKIMTGIVSMINSTASSFVTYGGVDKLKSAMEELGKAIGESFASIDWANVTAIITGVFTGLVSLFSSAISSFVEMGGPAKLKSAMATIGTAIGEAFASIKGKDLAEIINSISTGIINMFKSAITAFSKGHGWKEVGELFRNLDWGSLLTLVGVPLTLSIGSLLIKGLTYKLLLNSIIGSIAGTGAMAGGAGVAGTLAVVGGMLTLPLVVSVIVKKATDALHEFSYENNPYYQSITDMASRIRTKSNMTYAEEQTTNQVVNTMFKDEVVKPTLNKIVGWFTKNQDLGQSINDLGDSIHEWMVTPSPGYSMKSTDEMFPGDVGRGGGMNPLYKNQMVRYSMYDPLKDETLKVVAMLDNSEIPSRFRNLVDRAGNSIKDSIRNADIPGHGRQTTETAGREIKAAIDAADLPGKARTTANSAGTSMKDAITAANVPGRFRETALASISEFGKQDFASAGRQAGGSLRTGFDSGGVVSTVTTAAANAMAAFRNAAWASTGATAGATLGRTFKDHFVANAKSTLMLQTAAGKPITQAYVVPYANGGYAQGSLFLAGEVAGQAEMVGSINGRTGVASGEEITGIRESVDRAGAEEANLLRQLLVVGQALLAKDPFGTPNSAAGRWIAQSQQAYGKVTG